MSGNPFNIKDKLNIGGHTPTAFQEWALETWVPIQASGYTFDGNTKLAKVVADQYKFAQQIEINFDQLNTEHNGRLSHADLEAAKNNKKLPEQKRLLAEAIEDNYATFKQGSGDKGDISKIDVERYKAANDPSYLQEKAAMEKQFRDPQVFANELERNFGTFDPGNTGKIHWETGGGLEDKPDYTMEQRVIAEKFTHGWVGWRMAQMTDMNSTDVTKTDIEDFRVVTGNDAKKIDNLAWRHSWYWGPFALIAQPAKESDYYWLRSQLSGEFDMDNSKKMAPQSPFSWLLKPL